MMKDDDFKLLRGFADGQMDKQTDICDYRVAFATEKAAFICLIVLICTGMAEWHPVFICKNK